MANAATVERLTGVRSRIHDESRVSLSEFARGKEWRAKLATCEFMELLEHGERTAWVVSEEGMRAMVDYISELEEQVERASIRAMFESREGREEWRTGAELADAAKSYFLAHEAELAKAAANG